MNPTVVTVSGRRWWLPAAIVGGLLLGPLDLWGQVESPYPWAQLFNSPAVWATAAFGYGRWLRDRVRSPIGAVILLVVGVVAYYLADVVVRGSDVANLTSATTIVWCVAGVIAGAVFGTTGAWAAESDGWLSVLGRASLPAVFAAEAVHVVARVGREPADSRPADLPSFAVLLAMLAVISLVVLLRGTDRRTAVRALVVTVLAALTVGLSIGAVL
ncbi:MAG: DUF6518 family protein [Ilumatobacteraceae bacterium]